MSRCLRSASHCPACLNALARNHTVYAPYLPGTVPGDPDAHKALEDVWDLTLCYDEILDALGLGEEPVAIVGHSFGGMLGAELAAARPALVSKLVLLCPLGLSADGRPVQSLQLLSLEELAATAFAEPAGPVVTMTLMLPEGSDAVSDALLGVTRTIGVAAKFGWPGPDRGLRKRVHRITAPTLVIWGEEDKVISPEYADDFARLIKGCRAEVLDKAGHVPQLERYDVVPSMVQEFLAEP